MIPSFRMNSKEKRVPMTAYNQRCYAYIPWTPSTFLRSNCLIGLSFSRNVRLDLLVSLPGTLSEQQNVVFLRAVLPSSMCLNQARCAA